MAAPHGTILFGACTRYNYAQDHLNVRARFFRFLRFHDEGHLRGGLSAPDGCGVGRPHGLHCTAVSLIDRLSLRILSERVRDFGRGHRRPAPDREHPGTAGGDSRDAGGTREDFTGCLRLWGNGGLFGYYGVYQTTKLGKCYWYVTNRSKTVIVATPTRILVLSPDDLAGFIGAAGVPSTGVTSGDAPQFQLGSAWGNVTGKLVAIGIAGLALALISATLLYSPGPPGYTLTADRLTIHDRFYPVTLQADAIDAGHVRIVDLARESAWRPTLRTNGFANLHYQSGWFRATNGKTVRLYRAAPARKPQV